MSSLDYLSKRNPHERDSHISFVEETHVYTIDGDSDYLSVTTWIHRQFPRFNADAIIDKMMNGKRWSQSQYFGMTKAEIKAQWKENGRKASEAGTKMHYDIECFYNNMTVSNESTEFDYFKRFDLAYREPLKPYRTEWTVYDKSLKMAGSIDMVFENPDGTLQIYDWKRCKEIKRDNRWDSALTPCIGHLPDSNFWHYALQLNTYKGILERNYGKKVTDMVLVCLHPNNRNQSYIRIPVPDLSSEVNALFALRERVAKLMDPPAAKQTA